MKKPRRRFGTDEKATILRRYLVDKVPISDLCDEYGIKPNQIYAWQKILFDHAETAFQKATRPCARAVRVTIQTIGQLLKCHAKISNAGSAMSFLSAGQPFGVSLCVRHRDCDPTTSCHRPPAWPR